jgi:hypothetical protein
MPVEAMCDRLDVLDPDGFCTSCPRHGQRPVVLPPECFKGFIRIIQKKYRTTYARGTSCQVLIRVLLARLVRTEVLSKWKNQVLQKGCEVCFRFVLADGVPEGRVYGRRLVFVSVRTITILLPPRAQLCIRYCSNKHTHASFIYETLNSKRLQKQSRLQKNKAFETGWTRGGQSGGGVEDQPQCRGLRHSSSPSARSLSRSPSPPPPSFTQSPSPPRSLVCDGQTSPHRPRLVI